MADAAESFERAHACGVLEGIRRNHHRVRRMQVALVALIAAGLVAAGGYAWEEHNEATSPPTSVTVYVPSSSASGTSEQLARPSTVG